MTEPQNPSNPATDPGYQSGYDPAQVPAGAGADASVEPYPQDAGSGLSEQPVRPAPGFNEKGHVRRTRVSGVWIGLIATALFLVLLVVFIAQNSHRVSIHFFGWRGQFSLALTILLSAVIGVLLVAIPGSVRILQLRRALRQNVPGGMR